MAQVPSIRWTPTLLLTPLVLPWLEAHGVEVKVLRLDLLDPLISGNKWFKLRLALEQAAAEGAQGVISLGGAHSNHLHALAACGQRFGFATVGLLRGEPCITPTVSDLKAMGMQLHWLGYQGYRERHQEHFWQAWQARYPGYACINEGGLGGLGAYGCMTLAESVWQGLGDWPDFHAWWLAVGTGTTLAGLVMAEQGRVPVHGALAVPAHYGAQENIQALLAQANCADAGYQLHEAAGAGFATACAELLEFIEQTFAQSGLLLEPVYTGKALWALKQKVLAGFFPSGTRLVLIHTGGLQGARSWPTVGKQ